MMIAAVFACAAPAVSQIAGVEQISGIAAASDAAKSLAARLAPAAVDEKTVDALVERLSQDGVQLEMQSGERGNMLNRRTPLDARGRFRGIQANLIEVPASAVEEKSDAPVRDLVMRRYFRRLEAASEDWHVDAKTGTGQVDEWRYVVSLDGKLISVEHSIVPVEPSAPGVASPNEAKGRSYRMSPSDPSVRGRWEKFSKELLTLGRTVEV
jgi:hypothetical protein